jgi:hypothetical protein
MQADRIGVVDWPTLYVALDWVEAHCVIPDKFRRGEPWEASDWQAWCLLNHYRVREDAEWRPDNPLLAAAFHYRRSQIVLPQKAGKGPHTASQVLLESVGPALFAGWARGGERWDCRDHGCGCGWVYEYEPGEPLGMAWPTPLIQITAFSEEQTENIYDALRPMIEYGPLADVIPRTGEEFIRLPGGGRIDTVTSSAQSRLGQRVTFVPQDETGIWTATNKMVKVAQNQRRGLAGMGGRSTETTNTWDPAENSVAQQTAASAAADIFRYHPQAPSHLSYRDKRERRQIHKVVYAGSPWVNLDEIEAEAAELAETDPTNAERFFGNRIVAGLGTWLPAELWEDTEAPTEVPDGTEVCLGFDGSEVDDWTAIRLETYDGYRFTPTYGPDNRPTVWKPAEWPDGTMPRGEVMAAVDDLARRFKIRLAYCDPRDWQSEIGEWALKHGEETFLEWATYRVTQMHDALNRSLTDLASGRSTHDACPHTELAAANARKVAKPGDRYILGKPSQHQKIDPIMADTLAHEAAAVARLAGWDPTKPKRRNKLVVIS